MHLKFRQKNRTLIICVSGEIDHHSVAAIRQQTESAFTEMKGRNIIFCFQEVSFMDSAGIGMLIGRYKQVQAWKGRIVILCTNQKIIEILQISGLNQLIPVLDTLEDALSYIEGSTADAI